jgi:hypothetical protein
VLGCIRKVTPIIVMSPPGVTEGTLSVLDPASVKVVQLPRRHKDQSLPLDAVQVVRLPGMLPLAVGFLGLATVCGLPDQRVNVPTHFTRAMELRAYPVWLLYVTLIWHAFRRTF